MPVQERLLRGPVREERGGHAQRPGERRHIGPHHRHDLVPPRPHQLHRIGMRSGGPLPAVILKFDTNLPTTTSRLQRGVPNMASPCPSHPLWHSRAKHALTHPPQQRDPLSDCFSSSSPNSSSSFAYKLLALEHQAWHPSRVHRPADSSIRNDGRATEVPP